MGWGAPDEGIYRAEIWSLSFRRARRAGSGRIHRSLAAEEQTPERLDEREHGAGNV